MRLTPQHIRDKMVVSYLGGLTTRQVGERYGKTKIVVERELRRRGIACRGMQTRFTREDILRMGDLYISGLCAGKIGSLFGLSSSGVMVRRLLSKEGIPLRSRGSGEIKRKYTVNSDYFSGTLTEESAYWLGYIATDGNVDQSGSVLSLRCTEKDSELLYRFRECIGSNAPIKIQSQKAHPIRGKMVKSTLSAFLTVCSTKLVTSLHSRGIHPNKTFSVRPPELKNLLLLAAYWRGAVDGDGGLCRSKGGMVLYFSGNIHMVSGFLRFIHIVLPGCKVTPRKKVNIFEVRISGKYQVAAMAKVLYGSTLLALTRKKNLALEAIQYAG